MSVQSELTVRQARAEYFARNSFGEDGGYGAKWVKLKAGPIVFGFPNTKGRVRAVRLHDLHHILTGYETTWIGEAEIGAWEVASGCGRYYAGWILNLPGMAMGLFLSPRRIYRAFLRGRQSCNFYHGKSSEDVLDQPVELARRGLFLDRPIQPGTASDKLAFLAWGTIGLAALAWPLWLLAGAAAVWFMLRWSLQL